MVVEVDHPTAGKYNTAGNPIKTGAEERFDPPPTLGMNTSGVLNELLGYSEGEIKALSQSGAV
jgi:formyl-CoA transferase